VTGPLRRTLGIVAAAGAIVALLAAAPPAWAQGTFGMAGVQCSQFNQAARKSDMLYHQASQWLLGYVSGMNAAMRSAKGTTPVSNMTSEQVLKSTGDYCDVHPGSNLANAVNEWYASLPKQTDPQAAAEAKSELRGNGSLILNLDNAPKNKPLLDRH
jgi:FlaG/FlaF family flagellin (archaellin)